MFSLAFMHRDMSNNKLTTLVNTSLSRLVHLVSLYVHMLFAFVCAHLLVPSDLRGNKQLSSIDPGAFDKLTVLADLCAVMYCGACE